MSDRARSIANSERIVGTRSAAPLRRWLALGSTWAAAYEELAGMVGSLGDVHVAAARDHLRAVEDALDGRGRVLAVTPTR